MRTVPQLRFFFDNSVGHGAYLEDLIERAVAADDDENGGTDKGAVEAANEGAEP